MLPGTSRTASWRSCATPIARVEDLHLGSGWEAEFPRDVWELRRLGVEGRKRLRFDRIAQPWLRDLAKRFARWRLSIGRSPNQTYIDVQAVTRLARFLAVPGVASLLWPTSTGRLLERYLADLSTDTRAQHREAGTSARSTRSSTPSAATAGTTSLPGQRGVLPRRLPQTATTPAPRRWPSTIMAQVEQPANLDRWHNPESRLLTIILMRCGLRVGDATKVAFDCVVRDGDGAPYLRYSNHKMKREALVPIDEEVEAGIAEQQQRILRRWPGGSPWLFPAPKNEPRRPPPADAPTPTAARSPSGCSAAMSATNTAARCTSHHTNGAIPSEPG